MSRLEMELEHMLLMISPPFSQGWRAFIWDKAKRLAEKEPEEFANLPAMLASSAQQQRCTSSEKPAEQLGTDAPGPKPAATSTTALLASTGRQPMSLPEGS